MSEAQTPWAAREPLKVAVIGAGVMGAGIAHAAAMAGCEVALHDSSVEALEAAIQRIEAYFEKGVSRGKMDREHQAEARQKMRAEADLVRAVDGVHAVIEAVVEDLEVKKEIFARVEAEVDSSTLSRRCDSARSSSVKEPRPRYRDVRLGLPSSSARRRSVKDRPGFATSRLNAVIGNEAFRMLEDGVASARDIDKAAKVGLNHPMGPFEMVDLVGLDVRLAVLEELERDLGKMYRPTETHRRLVVEGRLGRKVGRGVFSYDDEGNLMESVTKDRKESERDR